MSLVDQIDKIAARLGALSSPDEIYQLAVECRNLVTGDAAGAALLLASGVLIGVGSKLESDAVDEREWLLTAMLAKSLGDLIVSPDNDKYASVTRAWLQLQNDTTSH